MSQSYFRGRKKKNTCSEDNIHSKSKPAQLILLKKINLFNRSIIINMKPVCMGKPIQLNIKHQKQSSGNTQDKDNSCRKGFLFTQEVTACKSLLCSQRCFPYGSEDILITGCPEIILHLLILQQSRVSDITQPNVGWDVFTFLLGEMLQGKFYLRI